MPKQAKGEVRFSGGIWRARVTLLGKQRLDVELPTCRDQREAEARALLLTGQARHLRQAGKVEGDGAAALMRELAAAPEHGLAEVVIVIGELCGAPALPPRGWRARPSPRSPISGRAAPRVARPRAGKGLHPRRAPLQAPERARDRWYAARRDPDHAVPARSRGGGNAPAPAQVAPAGHAQALCAVHCPRARPLGVPAADLLPKGFLPEVGKPPKYSFLYPADDATLLSCETVPLQERLLFGFLAREGMRLSEALGLSWRDVDLERGTVSLDANKTDDVPGP